MENPSIRHIRPRAPFSRFSIAPMPGLSDRHNGVITLDLRMNKLDVAFVFGRLVGLPRRGVHFIGKVGAPLALSWDSSTHAETSRPHLCVIMGSVFESSVEIEDNLAHLIFLGRL